MFGTIRRSGVPCQYWYWRSLLSSSGERKSGQGGGSSAWLTSRQGRYYAGANSRLGSARRQPPPPLTIPLNSSVQPPYTVSDATYTVTHPRNALSSLLLTRSRMSCFATCAPRINYHGHEISIRPLRYFVCLLIPLFIFLFFFIRDFFRLIIRRGTLLYRIRIDLQCFLLKISFLEKRDFDILLLEMFVDIFQLLRG